MSSLDPQVLAWSRRHHATVSSHAMDDLDLTVDQRRHLVRQGVLTRLVKGSYAINAVVPDELARCVALCSSRPQLVVAGPTAARLWNLRGAPRDELVHVIAPPRSHPCNAPWVVVHRTSAIADDEVVHRGDGIRLTSPPRTVLDMARHADADVVASMVEHVLERRLCTDVTLRRTALRVMSKGRPWVRRFLAILDDRVPGAPAESEWERRIFDELTRRGVVDLERQWEVQLPGYGKARFDIAIPTIRWALEIDVHPDHRSLEGVARDNRRDMAAEAAGWVVRRVAERQLTRDRDATLASVLASIERRRGEGGDGR